MFKKLNNWLKKEQKVDNADLIALVYFAFLSGLTVSIFIIGG